MVNYNEKTITYEVLAIYSELHMKYVKIVNVHCLYTGEVLYSINYCGGYVYYFHNNLRITSDDVKKILDDRYRL
jgi:hypothetical protein